MTNVLNTVMLPEAPLNLPNPVTISDATIVCAHAQSACGRKVKTILCWEKNRFLCRTPMRCDVSAQQDQQDTTCLQSCSGHHIEFACISSRQLSTLHRLVLK
jgi:hypothetical protein